MVKISEWLVPPVFTNAVMLSNNIFAIVPKRHVALLFVEIISEVLSVLRGNTDGGETSVTTSALVTCDGATTGVELAIPIGVVVGVGIGGTMLVGVAGRVGVISIDVFGADLSVSAFRSARVFGPTMPTGSRPFAF